MVDGLAAATGARGTAQTLYEFDKKLSGLLPGQDRIQTKLYTRIPPFNVFQWDNAGSFAFYHRELPISEGPRYDFRVSSLFGRMVNRAFDDLRDDPETTPISAYEPR
jgi:hypothetical protein